MITADSLLLSCDRLDLDPSSATLVASEAFLAERDDLSALIADLWGGVLRRYDSSLGDRYALEDLDAILSMIASSYARDAVISPSSEWVRIAAARAACHGAMAAIVRQIYAGSERAAIALPPLAYPIRVSEHGVSIDLYPAEDFLASIFRIGSN